VRSAATFNQKSLILPGVPDDRVRTGEYRAAANYNALLVDFFDHLKAAWVWRAKDRTVPKAKIVSVGPLGLVTTARPHGLAVGNPVQVQGTQTTTDASIRKLTYRATVYAVAGLTASIILEGRGGYPEQSQLGTIQLETIIYPAFSINNEEITHPTIIHRKVGSNFKRFRGRRTRNHF
jgi:hypothetical protein